MTGQTPEPTEERTVARPGAPRWVISLSMELRRGRQVVLTGRVRDRWWWDGRPAPFRTVLASSLYASGFEVVAWWSPVDGLTFPLEDQLDWQHERFEELHRQTPERSARPRPAPTAPPATAAPPGAAPPPGAAAPPDSAGARGPSVTSRGARALAATGQVFRPGPVRQLNSVDDALAEAHRMAAHPGNAIAFVFEDLDHVLPLGDPKSAVGYLRLRAAMADAVTPAPDPRIAAPEQRPRNPVLAVTGDLARLPGWLHREEPRTVVLQVEAPDQAERRRWFRMIGPEFNGGALAKAAEFEPLVAATDGLTGWELDALARTSHLRKAPLREPGKLLERYRLNVTTDPWTQLDHRTIAAAAEKLGARVIGQRPAVDAVVGALQAAYIGIGFGSSGASRPRGAFFFVGPTGVGKTELAKSVAELIFGDPSAYARFDMSEYQQEHAAERLAGAPPGYLGHERGGELTRRVQERPFSVLLFDEIEKAHPAVLDKFLQILEDGRLTDGQGQTAHFSQSLIIFTSNTGADGLHELLAEYGDDLPYEVIQEHFTEAVERRFRAIGRPEIYGRLRPGVVVFDMLRTEHVVGIAERLIAQLADSVRERHRVGLLADRPALHRWITERMSDPEQRAYGGRQIRNEFEAVLHTVVQHLMDHRPQPGSRLLLDIDEQGTARVRPAPAEGGE
ncbi:ATPase AAA [Kitasatospora sp. MMS16-BH015]|uniref:AAA family ATPase n=1 Tax=Kitasatospora sp. MMS16-BH015 TaxID=2018025 RepID=UPI000CA2AC03|nr:AAA family ATPase [Kitasatospora sp. MMS16-BH015]AUG76304.1 ATPase AAA [Kitasatospora sp. MMS16-BH015]